MRIKDAALSLRFTTKKGSAFCDALQNKIKNIRCAALTDKGYEIIIAMIFV